MTPSMHRQATAHPSLLCLAGLLACAAMPAAAADAGIDTIGGQRVESLTVKHPESTMCVVFENGSRATLESWNKVVDALAPTTCLFAYNRPGIGSTGTVGTPRDGETIVEELRRLLQHKGVKPPYILVGHSLGGLYTQLFARRHPDEVRGMVLVDALYPGVIKKPQDFPLLARGAKGLFFSSSVNREIDLAHQTGEQVLALPVSADLPVVQLINRPTGKTAVPVDFGMFNQDEKTRAAVKGMYPKATKIVLDSDHQMQRQSADAVVDAIRQVMAPATASASAP